MKELSLHILDIVQNSVKAKATEIKIDIIESPEKNLLEISIADNGCGMSKDFLERVRDPFATTRTTRKVGMGISLFEAAAQQCGGHLAIDSELGKGTTLYVCFELDNIDRVNIGLRTIRDMYESSVDDSSRYCKETERMTTYMSQLNSVYENMLAAMTVNMYNNPMAAMGSRMSSLKDEENKTDK